MKMLGEAKTVKFIKTDSVLEALILEANLTAAALLCVARGVLAQQPLTGFILKEDQDLYYRHRKQLIETGAPQACDLRMLAESAKVGQPEQNGGRSLDELFLIHSYINNIRELFEDNDDLPALKLLEQIETESC